MCYGQKKGAMGWFLASNYFLDRLGEDATDVRWGVMDNDESWVDTGTERHGACYKYMGGLDMQGDGKETSTAVDIKVMRLSEVYLIAAEAPCTRVTKRLPPHGLTTFVVVRHSLLLPPLPP